LGGLTVTPTNVRGEVFLSRIVPVNLNRKVDNGQPLPSKLQVVHFGLKATGANANSVSNGTLSANPSPQDDSNIEPAIQGQLLNYPNPFSQARQHTTIRYNLSKDLDIDLYIYDMQAHLIFAGHYPSGTRGGMKGLNNDLILDRSTLNGLSLTAGVYFYYVVYRGAVLGKSKMAVFP
jgi:hypothetical protein